MGLANALKNLAGNRLAKTGSANKQPKDMEEKIDSDDILDRLDNANRTQLEAYSTSYWEGDSCTC